MARAGMATDAVHWEQIADTLSHAVFLILEDGSFCHANTCACEILKYPCDELLQKNWFDIAPRNQRDKWFEAWDNYRVHRVVRFESTLRDRDGQEFPVLMNVTYNDAAGARPFLIAHAHDISESVRHHKQLLMAIRSAGVGFWELDLQTGGVYVSPELLQQVGQSDGEVWDFQVWKDLLHPDDHEQAVATVDAFQAGEIEVYHSFFRLRHVDGSYRWIESRGQLVCNAHGEPILIVGTHLDVTDQRRMDGEVRQMLRRSESISKSLARSNQDLEQFAYVASHDLRAPLRGLMHLTNWIGEDAAEADLQLPENILAHIGKLQSQVQRMDALLNGLLEYSRVGNREHMQRCVQLHDVLDNAIKLADVPPRFQIVFPEQSPAWVTVAETLQRVFQNLIDNATKHHDRDSGTIAITCTETAEDFVFAVIDDGPGIAEKHRQRVFEIFQTLNPVDPKRGSGLGLAIVKKLVQTAGGAIEIDEATPRGTQVRFHWPKQIRFLDTE